MTQCEILLRYLQAEDASITSYEAYDKLFITQLGRVIDDLQKRGIRFSRERIERNGKHFTRYSLDRSGEQTKLFGGAQ